MKKNNDLVCYCQEVTLASILKAIKKGNHTVESIQDATAAGIACGSCIETIETILEEN